MEMQGIKDLIDRRLEGTDMFLVDLKLTPGKLTVYVDRPGGIGISQCSDLNRFLNQSLEAEGFTESHEIEVSSPGADQPLRDYRQYASRIGKSLKVVLKDGTERKGRVVKADPMGFELLETGKKQNKESTEPVPRRFDFNDIREAKAEINI